MFVPLSVDAPGALNVSRKRPIVQITGQSILCREGFVPVGELLGGPECWYERGWGN